jgi:repressor LexA
MKISNTSERLKQLMAEGKLKQVDILEKCKPFCDKYDITMNKSDISQYVSGKTEPGSKKLTILGLALGVTETWLMGYDVPKEREETLASNIIPLPETKKVPLLGTIACGEPILAVENVADYVDMDADTHADFALRCKGDSMINARIFDGDIVYIRKQETVENGEIAAVLVNGMESEATLKRIYTSDDSIRLCAANPMYPDKIFEKENMNDVKIIGKAVAFLSSIK